MKKLEIPSAAREAYAAAYEAHYEDDDLPEALSRYAAVIEGHPDSPEEGFSRAQIWNIVRRVVPKKQLFDANVELLGAHLASNPMGGLVTGAGGSSDAPKDSDASVLPNPRSLRRG